MEQDMPPARQAQPHSAAPLTGPDSALTIASLYHKIAKEAPIPLALTAGPTHLLCGANTAFCQLLGIGAETLLGQPFSAAVPAADALRVQALLDAVYQSGTPWRAAEQELSAQGDDHSAYSIWPIPGAQGQPAGLVLLCSDAATHQHAVQAVRESRAVNEQLLIASLRELELVEQLQQQLVTTNAITQALTRAHSELEQTLANAQSQALADALTGLYNRRGFFTLAAQQLKLARRTRQTLCLLFIDLDGLKALNDRYGHLAGDAAIIAAARILSAAFRDSDIIARIGGDEFVVLAMGPDVYSLEKVAQRVQAQCARYNAQSAAAYQIALSIGVAHAPPDQPRSLDELLQQADSAMYAHKQAKKRATSGTNEAQIGG
jgi:diguanylate cyclase (GGDEF)-like protein